MNVWIDANLPTQLEATIIDLPILPIASGGTGADNTEEARSNLDVYSKAEVDEKLDNIEIDEVVPISKGGTGKITAKAAQNALLSDMNEATTSISDDATVVYAYATPADGQGAVYKRKALYIWNYIASKIRSTFGFSSSNVLPVSNGGTGATTTAIAADNLQVYSIGIRESIPDNSNLNNYTAVGNYACYASATSSSIANRPESRDAAFVLTVQRSTGSTSVQYVKQELMYYAYNYVYIRNSTNSGSTWTEWERVAFDTDLEDYLPLTGGTLTGALALNTPLGISSGGTGATTAAQALTNLGVTATAAELNKLDGMTATTAELNYVDGVTSNIQTQLNGKAASSHKHSAADITSGTLPIERGGTGLTETPSILVDLASSSVADVFEAAPTPGVTGTLPVSKGGTGAVTAADALSNLGITISTDEAPATGTPGTIYIQML